MITIEYHVEQLRVKGLALGPNSNNLMVVGFKPLNLCVFKLAIKSLSVLVGFKG